MLISCFTGRHETIVIKKFFTEEIKMKFGETIRIFRIANDYSITQVAKMTGISKSYISDLESGKKERVSLEVFRAIADCFKVRRCNILQIQEYSEKGKWTFQKTLLEVLRIYVGE